MSEKPHQTRVLKEIADKTMNRLKPEAKVLADHLKRKSKRKTPEQLRTPSGRLISDTTVEAVPMKTILEKCREAVRNALSLETVQTDITQKMTKKKSDVEEGDEDHEIDPELEELLRLADGEESEEENREATQNHISQELALEVIAQVFELYQKRPMTEAEESAAYQRILMTESGDDVN